MRYLSYILFIVLFGCRADDNGAVGPALGSNAFIHDSRMYADGCELYLQLDSGSSPNTGQRYLPTAASSALVQRVIAESNLDPKELVHLPVTIQFRETIHRRVISCGWVSPTVNEIDILAISRR